jgi:hypothetical protein
MYIYFLVAQICTPRGFSDEHLSSFLFKPFSRSISSSFQLFKHLHVDPLDRRNTTQIGLDERNTSHHPLILCHIKQYTDTPFGSPFLAEYTDSLHVSRYRVSRSKCAPAQRFITRPVPAWSPVLQCLAPRLPSYQVRGHIVDLSVLPSNMSKSSSPQVRQFVTCIAMENLRLQ